jgi:hypothetical protein
MASSRRLGFGDGNTDLMFDIAAAPDREHKVPLHGFQLFLFPIGNFH